MSEVKHLPPEIIDLYREYTESVSTSSAAISLETCKYLWKMCEERQPDVIVDTGSGFSSFVFRKWAKDRNTTVYSFDDSEFWIEKSKEFSTIHGVSGENFVVWKENTHHIKDVDILLHDLGNMTTRANTLEVIYNMMKMTGVILLDDLHKSSYRESAHNFFSKKGQTIINIDETKDEFSRFVGLVEMSSRSK